MSAAGYDFVAVRCAWRSCGLRPVSLGSQLGPAGSGSGARTTSMPIARAVEMICLHHALRPTLSLSFCFTCRRDFKCGSTGAACMR